MKTFALDWQPTRSGDEDPNPHLLNSGLLDSEESMPEISRFFGIVIQMHWREHGPPHFHAIYGSSACAVDIRSLTVISGKIPRRALALTLEWAAEHHEALMEDWNLCATKQTPNKIPPLE